MSNREAHDSSDGSGAMKTAQTPGPWVWYRMHDTIALVSRGHGAVMDCVRMGMAGAQPRFAFVEKDGLRIMRKWCDIDGMDHPDARLIAAAPDLLDALKIAMSAVESLHERVGSKHTRELLQECRAAIARAEGGAK